MRAFDPTTTGELTPHQAVVLDGIEIVADPLDVADGADVIAVFTEWPDFAKIELAATRRSGAAGRHHRRHPQPASSPTLVREAGFGYDGVGRR